MATRKKWKLVIRNGRPHLRAELATAPRPASHDPRRTGMSIEIRDQVTGDWLPAPKGFDVEEAIEDAQESNGAVDAVRENGVIVWAAS